MNDGQDSSRPPSALARPGPSSTANKRASTTVTTTVVGQDGIDSARVGACSNCRSRKIKCSGDRPTCKTCAKNNQQCDYPLHISRKRKDRESSSKRQPEGVRVGQGTGDVKDTRLDGTDASYRSDALTTRNESYHAHPSNHNNSFYPTLDFGIDPLTFQTQTQSDPAGIPLDNAWLENFLAYDFNNDISSVAGQNLGQAGGQAGMSGQLETGVPNYAGQTAYNPPSASSSGMGDGGSKGKSKAKFRVPYFR